MYRLTLYGDGNITFGGDPMQITKELLESLTCQDIEQILVYRNLLEKAKRDVEAIKEAYRFRIGEDKVTVWKDEHNAEYITHGGVWQARYLHQTYDLPVTVDAVFDAYKAEYEKKKHPGGLVNNLADSARYFRSFAQKARKMLESEVACCNG